MEMNKIFGKTLAVLFILIVAIVLMSCTRQIMNQVFIGDTTASIIEATKLVDAAELIITVVGLVFVTSR